MQFGLPCLHQPLRHLYIYRFCKTNTLMVVEDRYRAKTPDRAAVGRAGRERTCCSTTMLPVRMSPFRLLSRAERSFRRREGSAGCVSSETRRAAGRRRDRARRPGGSPETHFDRSRSPGREEYQHVRARQTLCARHTKELCARHPHRRRRPMITRSSQRSFVTLTQPLVTLSLLADAASEQSHTIDLPQLARTL